MDESNGHDNALRYIGELCDLRDNLIDALTLPLLFHAGGEPDVDAWELITGTREMTTKVMCDHIREVLPDPDEEDEL
jgi:hypothetical protein